MKGGLMHTARLLERALKWVYYITECAVALAISPFIGRLRKTADNEWLTLPNAISLTRIPLGILVLLSAGSPHRYVALTWFLIGVLSDHIDGSAARIMGPTKSGAFIDPMCDKIFFVLCALGYWRQLSPIALWTNICIDVFIIVAPPIIFLARKAMPTEEELKSNIYGKTKLALQCLALLLAILHFPGAASAILYLAAFLGILSIIKKAQDSKKPAETHQMAAAGR